ncbi:MAG: DUF2723 domain-containing protein [Elusimicrobiota bacterium]|jgi:hypothetical protein
MSWADLTRQENRRTAAAAVFLLSFGLYLWTMPPTLAPYRDAGEMSASTWTLGVSHPPSYPVYVMSGRLAGLLPAGTHAYRLNLLSALAGAGALALLWLALAGTCGPAGAFAAVLLLATNPTFWNVCGVQEMYSLTLLFAAGLLFLALAQSRERSPRRLSAFFLLYGLALGNRTDLLLWAPGLFLLAVPPPAPAGPGPRAFLRALRPYLPALAAGVVGLAVYLYLPLRSLRGPWLDWNHPATLYNLVGSLTRRGYGGTLDLLSKNYAAGANFLPNLKVYALHLWEAFGPLGLLLVVLGAGALGRAPRRGAAYALLYLLSGPLFLFLANMPPNPHALAIVEPHYLLSDLVLAAVLAEAVPGLAAGAVGARPVLRVLLLCALALQPWLMGRWARLDRRWNLLDRDYALNVLRSAPKDAVVVAKKDVQFFSLWHYQRVEGLRPDVRIVGQGLAHSAWLQRSPAVRYPKPLLLGPLRSTEEFRGFVRANEGPVFATTDVDFPPGLEIGAPRGLLLPLSEKGVPSAAPWEFLVRRGDYRYDQRPDFFTADLVEAHAVALQRLGAAFMEKGRDAEARRALLAAWAMKWLLADAPVYLGFMASRAGDWASGARYYGLAEGVHDAMLGLTEEYRSLPDVKDGVRLAASDALVNLGVAQEKIGRREDAERSYAKALALNPRMVKARYNLAVLYWNRDWPRVVSELQEALRVEPGYEEARRYLPAALAALEKSRPR